MSSTLLMQSWCWLIFQWLHWHQGFRLNPLCSAWPIAFGWIRLGTAFETAWRTGFLGDCGLWGRMGQLVGKRQWMLWRDVSSRGWQYSALSAVASSEEVPCPDSELISSVKPRTMPTVDGWCACSFPFCILVHAHAFRFHVALQCCHWSNQGVCCREEPKLNGGNPLRERKHSVWLYLCLYRQGIACPAWAHLTHMCMFTLLTVTKMTITYSCEPELIP